MAKILSAIQICLQFCFKNALRAILATLILSGIFCSTIYVFAVPPATKYDIGDTSDPSCAYGSENCDVVAPAAYSFSTNNFSGTGTISAGAITGTSFTIGSNTISDFAILKALSSLSNSSGVLTNDGSGVLSWSDVGSSSMVYPGAGIPLSTGSAWGTSITNNSANWNTAYGWGNHAGLYSLTSHNHSGVYEPVISAGTTGQYYRGDKSWQTLDKTAVGLGSVENTALSTWTGSTSITTLGTIVSGTWNANAIADTYIASAVTWNAKQTGSANLTSLSGLTYASGTPFVKMTSAGNFALDTNTYLTANQSITLSGDISGSGTTAITTTIGADKITEAMLKAVNSATDEYYLTYESTTGDFEWQAGGGSMVYPGAGIAVSTGSAWGTSITNNSANWNTAYGWGNHAGLYSLTSHNHSGVYEPVISAGTTGQYYRGDKSWQTLNKTAVGLGSVENTALSTWTGSTSITTLGTITSGIWTANAIADSYISSSTTWNAKQAGDAELTGLSALTYSSGTSFVKMTAAGTFALDTNTYLTSLSGALLADGTVTGATSQAQAFTNGVISSTITGGSATTADLNLKTTSGVGETGADMHFLVGNNGATEAMTILNSGNVGVGTTSPNKLLDISSNSIPTLRLSNEGHNEIWETEEEVAAIEVYSSDSSYSLPGVAVKISAIQDSGLSGARVGMAFYTFNETSLNEILRLGSSGNVGIGTSTPTNILSFGGDSARTIWLERNTTTNGSNLTLQSGGGLSGGTNLNGGSLYLSSGISTGSGSSDIFFQTAGAGGSGTSDNAPSTKMTILGNGNVGIGISPSYPLDVKGTGTGAIIARFNDVNTTGCTLATGGTISCSSDERLKKNITDINYGLADLMKLRPVEFNWKYENDDNIKSLGFIAQEIESIIPKLVMTDLDGTKQLNTVGLIPILTKSIQEQQKAIEDLKLKINGNGTTGDGTVSGIDFNSNIFVDAVKNVLATLGLKFENGVTKVKTVEIEKMQMKDSATGDIYCTWIQNGEWQKTKGACENANTETPPADNGQTGGDTGGGDTGGGEEPTVVSGCTDSKANNYNKDANKDDGSCTYDVLGCMDSKASNYNSQANKDDGSCQYPPAEETPPADNGQTNGGAGDGNAGGGDVQAPTE